MRGRLIAITVLGAASVVLPASASGFVAEAPRTPCVHGQERPLCHVWTARVLKVSDGDTITVDVDGDGRHRADRIRMIGIQAMELTRYAKVRGRAGECHGVDATEYLERLVAESGGHVRLAAMDPASTTGWGKRVRLRRQVSVVHGGRWFDTGALLLHDGLALWMANDREWAWNGRYSRLAEDAATRQVGIWDGRSCGTDELGPAANALRLKVKWNASGNDGDNLNGEWVRITNTDAVHPLNLDGWWLRDSALRRYRFPPGAVVLPGHTVRLLVGSGVDDVNTYHWGLTAPAFDNATNDRQQIGDGGYLFDPRGNLRAHVQYPCRTNCSEPLAGKTRVEAHYVAPDYIRVRNVSDETIDLYEYEIERAPSFYEFGPASILFPNQSIDLYVERPQGLEGAFARTWDDPHARLADTRGVVTLRSPIGAPVTCFAWGGGVCPSV